MNISLQMSKGGIKAHQKAMSNIANNIANVNSEGYKAKSAHFTSLLNNDRTAEDGNFTVNAGVRNAIVGNNFSQGALRHSPSTLQLSVADEGFFQVEDSLGNTYLTRDGTFFKDASGQLVNSAGDALVYEAILPEAAWPEGGSLAVAPTGELTVDGELVGSVPVFLPESPATLQPVGGNKYEWTEGVLIQGESQILHHYAETSNVDLAQELTNMIVTQRAYSLNVKVAQASDETMQLINQFKQ